MLISPEYRDLNAELHERIPTYGTGGHRWARWVKALARKTESVSVLDYGCGKGALGVALSESGLDVREYDPAIPGKSSSPSPADIVACLDVLEHVEGEFLHNVLCDITRLAQKAVLLSICCKEGQKRLADGRPAHILVRPHEWWESVLSDYGRFKRINEGESYEFNAVYRIG